MMSATEREAGDEGDTFAGYPRDERSRWRRALEGAKRIWSHVVQTIIRRARTADVPSIRNLIDVYAADRILLSKATVTLYEDIQEFWVAERDGDGSIVGCGALHVMWSDLAEVRTVAVHRESRGLGVGRAIVEKLIATAAWLGVRRVFCLTFETAFFAAHGFVEIEGTPVSPEVYTELLRSYDEGVAEFLGLERVKPNTLGNARMILEL